ncbi:MAG: hypothetical protein ABIJ97_11425, partial [Bacteroidota bacterium]
MKKIILIKTTLLFVLFANAQIVNIPDANFKAALVGNSLINTNGDGEIQVSEASIYNGIINVPNMNIADLTGIEAFASITDLRCGANQLTSIDISSNTALTFLQCSGNLISSIDVSNNINLSVLQCGSNQLSFLDVNNNTNLNELVCNYNLLSSLDLSNNLLLTFLNCQVNQIDTLDISNNTALTYFDCSLNLFSSIDVSNNIALTELRCFSNQLNTLNVSNNVALTKLLCGNNQFNSLDLSNNTSLANLNCKDNLLDSLNLFANIALEILWCSSCGLTSLDVSNNTALKTLNCYSNPINTLDVSNNILLITIDCHSNQLDSLDLSNNIVLTNLSCSYNQLSNLDISNNTALNSLACSNNDLTTLDVSNNTVLTYINCGQNQLDSLDVSNNIALEYLDCWYNQIQTLDISNNNSITKFECEFNQLTTLNVKNGNNINFTLFYAFNNPNLYCINVDDPIWSLINWTSIDPWALFSSDCSILTSNNIIGKVVTNDNCIMDGTEQGIDRIIVKTGPNDFYSITDNLGNYTISTDTGTYQVEQIIFHPLITPLCPNPNYHIVHFDSLTMDTTDIDFYNEVIACPFLTIDVSSDMRRRCFTNNTFIHYCNDGFADESGVEVHVQLPDYVIFISANYSYTLDTLGNYVFDIGTLAQGDCGDIHIIDSVACITGITGLTQCTEAWITPANDCANSLDTAAYNAWDHSSVMVEGECIGDSIVRFIITNTGDVGTGDMQIPSEYRIYADNLLVFTGTFQLNGQEEMVIEFPADGMTYRLEADQHPMHPGNSHPNETIENCGNPYNSTGFVNTFAMDDADAEIEIDCMQILGSYDPNDKSVSPEGFTANNYIMPGASLDYVIRFQNTGSDTAFTVVVVDTLSAYLDISTFQAGISSHPYTLDVRGQGRPVLLFQFFNINLPDSTTNEALSHGFVKFKIALYDTLVNGTVVENTANIYFDYNIPVITNTTFVTISDTVIYGNPLVIQDMQNKAITDVKIYPN